MPKIQTKNYNIFFENETFELLNKHLIDKKYSKIFILVDNNTHENCLNLLITQLETNLEIEIIEIEAGEQNKNIETCLQLWEALIELNVDRKGLIINLGGGVITDMGGFVACTIKRGIDFINIPTTLLAMVDASVGGKNGVDLGKLKNQIGLIAEPSAVVINTSFLSTLPQNEMKSGLAEMLKHGLIDNKKYWDEFKNFKNLNSEDLEQLIYQSVEIKNNIVSQDLTENGIRKTLNFGHTLGHAIESYCLDSAEKTTLLHGEAIAIGMILESNISMQNNFITKEEYAEIKYVISDFFEKVNFTKKDIDSCIDLLIFDKKNEYGNIQFVLLNKIGNAIIDQKVENNQIYKAFEDYLN